MMRRIVLLVTVVLCMALMMALFSGVALAQGAADVCVRIRGDTKVDRGESNCFSDETSKAVAIHNSYASAASESRAMAVNDSYVGAIFNSEARATNDSSAFARDDSEATAANDSYAEATCEPEGMAPEESYPEAPCDSE